MFKQLLAAALFVFVASNMVFAQDDAVLFTVQNTPVRVSEFRYIYSKTNQDKADFSKASLDEYLDLYIKFKLKVQKAREMRLDTVEALRTELEGYRRQLANSYLIDREVTDKLIRETHERMLQDADISHIFVTCDRNAKAADTLTAYNRAMDILKTAQAPGADFSKIAAEKSEDKSAKENSGNLGFVTAMFPDGFYLMEKGVYATKPGTVFGPVRSNSGYHIVKVNGFRPARGEMEVAQILLRKGDSEEKNVMIKRRADSIYNALQGGAWDELCAKYSDDKTTSMKGGYIGFFGINRYQRNFEDAAFALAKDGDFTRPVETSIGWHIIKRISARPVQTFDQMKRALTERVKRDSRSEVAKQSMIAKIKREGKFQDFPAVYNAWLGRQVDTVFLTFKWKPAEPKPTEALLKFGSDKTYSVADFEEYCARASRERMRGAGTPMSEVAAKLYKNWSDDVAMQFEESQLDKKYPDFKALMREYEEGILLFDATKQLVWDKANTDTLGLEKFFNSNLKEKYKWDERASVSLYTVKTDDPKEVQKIRELAAKKDASDVLKKANKKEEMVSVLERQYEKGKNKDLADIWKEGGMTAPKTDAGTKTATFMKIEKIAPPTPKTLNEARGYAVADYQDWLEKQWIEDLRKAYPVKVDNAVLNSLVKK